MADVSLANDLLFLDRPTRPTYLNTLSSGGKDTKSLRLLPYTCCSSPHYHWLLRIFVSSMLRVEYHGFSSAPNHASVLGHLVAAQPRPEADDERRASSLISDLAAPSQPGSALPYHVLWQAGLILDGFSTLRLWPRAMHVREPDVRHTWVSWTRNSFGEMMCSPARSGQSRPPRIEAEVGRRHLWNTSAPCREWESRVCYHISAPPNPTVRLKLRLRCCRIAALSSIP